MADGEEQVDVVLVFQGRKEVMSGVPRRVTEEDLRERVADATGEDSAMLRVLCRGKVVVRPRAEGQAMEDAGPDSWVSLGNGERLMVLATTHGDAQTIKSARPDPLLRPFEGTKRTSKYLATPYSSGSKAGGLGVGNCGFGGVEELPNFPDRHRAKQILEQLANDEGVTKVMVKHSFRVGMLKEMYPDGKVGVDPVCVLGLNKNKGMEILLRLRTDDLKGFRPYWKLREVLFHELAHNVHSEHNADFFQLMNQLQREADAMDWKAQKGQTTGAAAAPSSSTQSYQTIEKENVVWGESTRLGDGGNANAANAPGEAAAMAALRRQEHLPQPKRKSPTVAAQTAAALAKTSAQSEPEPADAQEPVERGPSSPPALRDPSPTHNGRKSSDQIVDDARRLARQLLDEVQSPEAGQNAIRTLLLYLNNALTKPNETKYRSINRENAAFHTRVGRFVNALALLDLFGFVSIGSTKLELQRPDHGLLWLGTSVLEEFLA